MSIVLHFVINCEFFHIDFGETIQQKHNLLSQGMCYLNFYNSSHCCYYLISLQANYVLQDQHQENDIKDAFNREEALRFLKNSGKPDELLLQVKSVKAFFGY